MADDDLKYVQLGSELKSNRAEVYEARDRWECIHMYPENNTLGLSSPHSPFFLWVLDWNEKSKGGSNP